MLCWQHVAGVQQRRGSRVWLMDTSMVYHRQALLPDLAHRLRVLCSPALRLDVVCCRFWYCCCCCCHCHCHNSCCLVQFDILFITRFSEVVGLLEEVWVFSSRQNCPLEMEDERKWSGGVFKMTGLARWNFTCWDPLLFSAWPDLHVLQNGDRLGERDSPSATFSFCLTNLSFFRFTLVFGTVGWMTGRLSGL